MSGQLFLSTLPPIRLLCALRGAGSDPLSLGLFGHSGFSGIARAPAGSSSWEGTLHAGLRVQPQGCEAVGAFKDAGRVILQAALAKETLS